MLLIISILLCFLFGEHSANALYGAVASISNVGASVGPTIGSMGNFGREPEAVKFIFTVNMFLGRLEIYPVLAIFSLIMQPKRRQ